MSQASNDFIRAALSINPNLTSEDGSILEDIANESVDLLQELGANEIIAVTQED